MPYSIQLLLLMASLSPLSGGKKSPTCAASEPDLREVIEPVAVQPLALAKESSRTVQPRFYRAPAGKGTAPPQEVRNCW